MQPYINSYSVDLIIDVKNQFISANVLFNYHCKEFATNELKLYIYKDITIDKICSDREMIYQVDEEVTDWCPFILESKLIKITFGKAIAIGENININFQYKGHISLLTKYGINRISMDWVELGLYSPWFPIVESLEAALFNVNIKIDKDYEVVNSKKLRDTFVLNKTKPYCDCSIICSNRFSIIREEVCNLVVNTYFIDYRDREFAMDIANYSKLIFNKYFNFGKIGEKELSIVLLPREEGGGYCRPNLVVLTTGNYSNNKIGYFKYLAHELAHLWWCKANSNSWEDWLNESFAEYSALIVLREVFGEEEFATRIEKYKIKAEGLPAIEGIDRGHDKAYEVLYIKGSYLLYELEKTIGREKFIELLNIIHTKDIDNTDKFLKELESYTNEEIKDEFKLLLSKSKV